MTAPTSAQIIAQAFNRFGLGGRLGDTNPTDPAAWLKSQLMSVDPTSTSGLMTTAEALRIVASFDAAPAGSTSKSTFAASIESILANEIAQLYVNAVTTSAPFRERLVWFWFNHFAVMADANAVVRATAGAYVREAIRPHVTGKFSDMLVAVIHHPAMLCSLNNNQSFGSSSKTAINAAKHGTGRSINENLGRETLELYTLGIASGYTQADVDALANLLTGFKVSVGSAAPGYVFDPAAAQPGEQTLLGTPYQATDAGCTAALRALAIHPATCLHIATKLVTHFVSDTPSAADVLTVANVFQSTGGDLTATSDAVIDLASAWTPLTKLRTPSELVIAAMRAVGTTGAQVPVPTLTSQISAMGSLPFGTDFPNGWSDLAADWTAPEQMLLRVNWIYWFVENFRQRGATQPALTSVVDATVLPFLSRTTAAAIAGDTNAAEQLLILFSSPEFQRR